MHAERKATVCSHKHSFIPYPSLSPCRQTDGMTDRVLEEWPESSWSLLLVACNHTWYSASHDGHFGPYHGPKNKNKDSSHCSVYFKRVSYLSNFSKAVQLLVIPEERSEGRSFPFPFLQKEILWLGYCSLKTDSCFQRTSSFPSSLDEFIHPVSSVLVHFRPH